MSLQSVGGVPESRKLDINTKAGSTYPLDLVRSRLSIATASVSLAVAPLTKQTVTSAATSHAQPARHALASAYHTSSSVATNAGQTLSSVYTKADLTISGMTKKIMREEGGVRALYRGMMTTAVGVAPYVGINFAAYEFFRGTITPPGKSSVWRKLSCGALAGRIHESGCEMIIIFFFGRIYLSDFDISVRCLAKEDASDGHERYIHEIQRSARRSI